MTGSDDGIVRLWDAKTGAQIRRFEGHFGTINSIAVSTQGASVLTGSEDGVALLWDLSGMPSGDVFRIVCELLPDQDLSSVVTNLPIQIEQPICDYENGYDPPLPPPPGEWE